MKKKLLSCIIIILLFAGCAAQLQYLAKSRAISSYKINSVAVLPFYTDLQAPGISETAGNVFIARLLKSALYSSAVPPDRVKELMADEEFSSAVTRIKTSIADTGMADPETAVWLCSELKADALIACNITQWSKSHTADNDTFKIELDIRIAAKDGKTIWHGTDAESFTPSYNDWDVDRTRMPDDKAFDTALGWVIDKVLANLPAQGK